LFRNPDSNNQEKKVTIQSQAYKLLQKLKKHKNIGPFSLPVNPVALNIPNYFNVIKEPMDVSKIEEKLQSNSYVSLKEFTRDVNLIWQNAMTFNPIGTQIYNMASELSEFFNKILTDEQEAEKLNKMKDKILTMESKLISKC
jgi:hypothetical protein